MKKNSTYINTYGIVVQHSIARRVDTFEGAEEPQKKFMRLRLTEVVVSPYVDIHEDITLCCRFDTDGEKLHSVKWYKDELDLRPTEVVVSPYVDIHEDITLCCRFDTDGEKLHSDKWYKDELEFCYQTFIIMFTTMLQSSPVCGHPRGHHSLLQVRHRRREAPLRQVVQGRVGVLLPNIYNNIYHNVAEVTSLRLTEVVVPPYVDIHEDITLCCRFDTDGEKLYSVKWYKDELEFFRYMPGNTPHTQIFPRPGIVLDFTFLLLQRMKSDAVTDLTPEIWSQETLSDKTSVTLTALSFNTSGTYRCEVSTEAFY
ncbi:hypothetical protein J6590_063896 [Homalodisca vitripennis]|nr:hypothetical protein J6590_063896 [Homalodisca vitripennis]